MYMYLFFLITVPLDDKYKRLLYIRVYTSNVIAPGFYNVTEIYRVIQSGKWQIHKMYGLGQNKIQQKITEWIVMDTFYESFLSMWNKDSLLRLVATLVPASPSKGVPGSWKVGLLPALIINPLGSQ